MENYAAPYFKKLPQDAKGRAENLKRSTLISRFLNDSFVICCASFVAPKNDSKEHAFNVVSSENCFVVYCNPPVEICIKRNPSGLYAAFEDNKTDNVPNLSFPYEKPERVDFELDKSSKSIDESLNKITPLLEKT